MTPRYFNPKLFQEVVDALVLHCPSFPEEARHHLKDGTVLNMELKRNEMKIEYEKDGYDRVIHLAPASDSRQVVAVHSEPRPTRPPLLGWADDYRTQNVFKMLLKFFEEQNVSVFLVDDFGRRLFHPLAMGPVDKLFEEQHIPILKVAEHFERVMPRREYYGTFASYLHDWRSSMPTPVKNQASRRLLVFMQAFMHGALPGQTKAVRESMVIDEDHRQRLSVLWNDVLNTPVHV